jgi:carotenoid cleavage dioxygenase-like enzyme
MEEVDLPGTSEVHGGRGSPTDLEGVYLRNTENPVHQPLGRYHPFDGDGMIHRMVFRGGQRELSRTASCAPAAFEAEQEAGGALWGGLADPIQLARRPGFGAHGSA